MSDSLLRTEDEAADGHPRRQGAQARGLRWWVRVIEVRLRFFVLLAVVLIVVTQWQRLRRAWDDCWYAWGDGPAASAVSGDIEYFCPMDPGVVSIWPAICPICNMDLVQRKKHDAQLLPEGVVARMQISPYRVQLAGIRTAEVQPRELVYAIPVSGVLSQGESTAEAASPDASLQFELAVSRSDAALLLRPRAARVAAANNPAAQCDAIAEIVSAADAATGSAPAVPRVRVRIASECELVPGMRVDGMIHVPAVDLVAESQSAKGSASEAAVGPALLAVPETAVVDHGHRELVFVESMPGTFDAVAVRLGPRCGDYYPVLGGLERGQRIAVAGAFLIDAETRLNPSLAVAYFGANQASSGDRMPEVRVASRRAAPATPALSPQDAALAKKQGVCPVTSLPLDSMGGPVLSVVEGRKVFLCCKGCEPRLQKDPATYLGKLAAP